MVCARPTPLFVCKSCGKGIHIKVVLGWSLWLAFCLPCAIHVVTAHGFLWTQALARNDSRKRIFLVFDLWGSVCIYSSLKQQRHYQFKQHKKQILK